MSSNSLIADLKDRIAGGSAVFVAGTGVSIAASGNPEIEGHRVATWPGLIQDGIKRCLNLALRDSDRDGCRLIMVRLRCGAAALSPSVYAQAVERFP